MIFNWWSASLVLTKNIYEIHVIKNIEIWIWKLKMKKAIINIYTISLELLIKIILHCILVVYMLFTYNI